MWMDKVILLIEMFLALFPAGILGLYLDIFFPKVQGKFVCIYHICYFLYGNFSLLK